MSSHHRRASKIGRGLIGMPSVTAPLAARITPDGCPVYGVPYGAGKGIPPPMKYALRWEDYTQLLLPVLAEGRRPLLASFMGSNWTYVCQWA